jgi:ATP-dependent DNA helicase RecG
MPLELEQWFVRLQKSLALEVEAEFGNLQGRLKRFNIFLESICDDPPKGLTALQAQALSLYKNNFANYDDLSIEQRQKLVIKLRRDLHKWRQELQPISSEKPPRLNLGELQNLENKESTYVLGFNLDTTLAQLPGVSAKLASQLASMNLWVVKDLVHYYPRDYVDYSQLVTISNLVPGSTATIVATVKRCHAFVSHKNPNLSILDLQLQDQTGRLKISKFMAGRRFSTPAWLHQQMRIYTVGAKIAASGLVKEGRFGMSLQDPLLEVLESSNSKLQSREIGRMLPVYSLVEGLVAEKLREVISKIFPILMHINDPLPRQLQAQLKLLDLPHALEQIHQPHSKDQLEAARRRLVFDEFLLLQLALGIRRQQLRQRQAPILPDNSNGQKLLQFLELLPFQFTPAQARVLQEIRADMAKQQPMARLLQGDVGSGKTVVAVAALLCAIDAGHQGALMAPTEVLAQQHYEKLCSWMPQLHVTVDLLTGSTSAPRRRRLLQDLANGQLDFLVGTHALLEDPVVFARLGLVVVDEQHRFGVAQRNRLLNKGLQPHLLTMTATPIPRTLALSVHGDLDVSQIDSLPPGRIPIQTQIIDGKDRELAENLIREQVAAGYQAYVVLPLVEDSEKIELRSAVEEHQRLAQDVFPDLNLGLLHGRLNSAEKQLAIEAFARGLTQVLVSTTVVEVGVDVPNATVMVIEHAERFGLAQMHQLRGRVGRGSGASHCLLINNSNSAIAKQRLDVLARSSDGFEIAEVDLRIRGPGQVLGTQQSGLPDLALASLSDDGSILEQARDVAQAILLDDPELISHIELAKALELKKQKLANAARLN